jgi:anti-sigma factor RsiW
MVTIDGEAQREERNMRTLSRRRSATIAAFVGVAIAIGSGAVAANAATMAPATTSSSTNCSFGRHLRPLPAALTADLKTPKGETKSRRAATLETISGKALAGTYGTTIESFARVVESSTVWTACTSVK